MGLRYDTGTILLHWVTAVLVLCLAISGELLNTFARPVHHALTVVHMTGGVLLGAVIAVRIAWRLLAGRRLPGGPSVALHRLASAMAVLLYVLIVAAAFSGFAWRWGRGRPMTFFSFSLPSPLAIFPKAVTHTLGAFHWWVALVIIGAVMGHVAMAIWHIRRQDGVFSRMV